MTDIQQTYGIGSYKDTNPKRYGYQQVVEFGDIVAGGTVEKTIEINAGEAAELLSLTARALNKTPDADQVTGSPLPMTVLDPAKNIITLQHLSIRIRAEEKRWESGWTPLHAYVGDGGQANYLPFYRFIPEQASIIIEVRNDHATRTAELTLTMDTIRQTV